MSFLFQAQRHGEYAETIAKSANALGYHFGAIVFKGNNVVSAGWCQCKTHPKQARYMRYAKPYKRNNSYLHAEMHALIVAKDKAQGCDMVVARWANDQLKCSHPCDACWRYIQDCGIRRVWFWQNGELIYKEIAP